MEHAPIRTLADLDRVAADARALVTKRALVSAGAATVPVPGADLLVDANLLARLLPEINRRFGVSEEQLRALSGTERAGILLAAAKLGNTAIGRGITRRVVMALLRRAGLRYLSKSVTRFVPFVGQAAAAGVSFGAMKLVGNAHIDDCCAVVRERLRTAD